MNFELTKTQQLFKQMVREFAEKEVKPLAAEIKMKYKGYIEREKIVADKMHRLEGIKIRGHFKYSEIQEISTEGRQKLEHIDPETLDS